MIYASDYVAPPTGPPVQRVASLESEHGHIILAPNRFRFGYKLGEESTGFGPADVDNELTPRAGRRGAMLGVQRETEGDMELQVFLNSTSPAEIRRMVAELTTVMKPANGTFRIILTDPTTGEGRYRDVAYQAGLKTPVWSSPYGREYKITVEYLDPWVYSVEGGRVNIPVAREASGGLQAPVRVPVRVARSGGAVDRWGTNKGENPSPVTLRFDGPVTDPEVFLQGHWSFRIRGRLAWDEYLVIDPSDLSEPTAYVYSTTGADRRAAYNMIQTGSRLTDLILPPGQHSFTFRAIDPTFTASMTATWPHTYASMH